MEKKINYSFIIPHKNCPDLLRRCVDSIPQRNDIQIIVVDDNSAEDKKPNLGRKDVEVILLDAEHSKGAGRARNVGLEHAKGKWLLFADADDYYSDNLEALLENYIDDDCTDIVYLNAYAFDENDNPRFCKTDRLIRDYLEGKNYSEMHLRYNMWTPWSRMVKRYVVENNCLRFDEIPAGNDFVFGLNCSRFSKIMQVEPSIIYKYFKPSKGSVTDKARIRSKKMRLDLRGRGIVIRRAVGYRYASSYTDLFLTFVRREGMSKCFAFKYCKLYLDKYNISLVSDIWQYVVNKIYSLVQKK